jgi:hypothetical protein
MEMGTIIMTKLLKNFIRGAGSIVKISPRREKGSVKAGRFYSAKNDGHSINKDWLQVGRDIRSAAEASLESNGKAAKESN